MDPLFGMGRGKEAEKGKEKLLHTERRELRKLFPRQLWAGLHERPPEGHGQAPERGRQVKPCDMTAVIDRKRYSTRTARLLVDDACWDRHNFERYGRNTFLYRSPGGSYFALHMTCWQGEKDHIEPLT